MRVEIGEIQKLTEKYSQTIVNTDKGTVEVSRRECKSGRRAGRVLGELLQNGEFWLTGRGGGGTFSTVDGHDDDWDTVVLLKEKNS